MDGCVRCGGTGRRLVSGCPLLIVPSEVWTVVEMASLYINHGLPAVAGGQLDQARTFLAACRLLRPLIVDNRNG
jgi:hypothetical protein